jgi:hypothetical protein
MYNGFDFGKTEIFFRSGLDKAESQDVADLPVGQNQQAPFTSPRLRGEVEAEAQRRLRVRGTLDIFGPAESPPHPDHRKR